MPPQAGEKSLTVCFILTWQLKVLIVMPDLIRLPWTTIRGHPFDFIMDSGYRGCVITPFPSFRASGARYGIQSRLGGIQYVLDAGWSLSAFGWPA